MVYISDLNNSCKRPRLNKERGTYLLISAYCERNGREERKTMHE